MKTPVLAGLVGFCFASMAVDAATLQVDKQRSAITVDVSATGHQFTGTLKDYRVEGSGSSTSLIPEAFSLKWKFKDLDTDNRKRDKEMMHWLGGADPEGSFKFIKSWQEKDGTRKALGELTIHGVSRQIAFPYAAGRKDGLVVIDGVAEMNYEDFNLPVIRSMLLLTVDPKLVVRFHLEGKMP